MSVVETSRSGPRLTITLNRPERLNAIATDMLEEMLAILDAAASDTSLRVVVLTGAGRAFCAGGDLNSTGSGGGPGRIETTVASSRRAMRISELLRSMPQPVIAAINGACAGAGLSWACAADLRVAVDTTTFATAFTAAAVGGDHGISWLLPRIVGYGRAAELLLLAERFYAEDALRIGLVSKVVTAEELMPTVEAWTTRLLGLAPGALASMKANLREGQTISLGETFEQRAPNFGA
jgi:2-(1,2-epoxy-1,2-dihydrophenyl)acetyl-CoA isomerase